MTDALDTRLNALLEKATKGPWEVERPLCAPNPRWLHIVGPTLGSGVVAKIGVKREDDARLIVEAVNALPQLLADRLSDREAIREAAKRVDAEIALNALLRSVARLVVFSFDEALANELNAAKLQAAKVLANVNEHGAFILERIGELERALAAAASALGTLKRMAETDRNASLRPDSRAAFDLHLAIATRAETAALGGAKP